MDLLEETKIKFCEWRKHKRTAKEKIPEDLLKKACECAHEFGRQTVIKHLGIGYTRLVNAMDIYPKTKNIEMTELNLSGCVDFHEVKITECVKTLEPNRITESAENKENSIQYFSYLEKEIQFEIESKFGFHIKVFTKTESVHRSLVSCLIEKGVD